MKTIVKGALLFAGIISASATWAIGTPAGTKITNTAVATFDDPATGTTGVTTSDAAELTVLELISVNVTAENVTPVTTNAGDTAQVLTYTVTNTGNGSEAFALDATNLAGDQFDAENIKVYVDTDGDGVFSAGDQLLTSGSSINLDANSSNPAKTIFVVVDIPAGATTIGDTAKIQLEATSDTPGASTAAPGDLLVGAGTGVSDAVVGNNVTDTASATFTIGAEPTTATVNISKTIAGRVDPFGGTTDVPGTVVTYQIDVEVVGGDVDNLVITDAIPTNMTYVAGTLTLDAAAQTDADDVTDNSNVTAGAVTVTLGTVTSGTSYVIQLQAEIK
jgi:uncharacterized repeat protein (TIGR01451 family)